MGGVGGGKGTQRMMIGGEGRRKNGVSAESKLFYVVWDFFPGVFMCLFVPHTSFSHHAVSDAPSVCCRWP